MIIRLYGQTEVINSFLTELQNGKWKYKMKRELLNSFNISYVVIVMDVIH